MVNETDQGRLSSWSLAQACSQYISHEHLRHMFWR